MSSQRLVVLLVCSVTIPMLAPASLPAQGILRRLRERIVSPPSIPVPAPGLPGSRFPGLRIPSSRVPASPLPNTLPARPYPPSTRPPAQTATPSNSAPISRYQVPSRSIGNTPATARTRIPASPQAPATAITPASPTPASQPSAVAQTSASEPIGSANSGANSETGKGGSSFGRSILKPFGFNETPIGGNPSVPASTIGIQGANANPGYPGVQVKAFREHSRADEAGLRIGDYIFGLDGDATPDIATLAEKVAAHAPGETVSLRIGRDGRVSDLDVQLVTHPGRVGAVARTIEANPSANPGTRARVQESLPIAKNPKIGADVQDINGMRGVVVTGVGEGSLAAAGGLRVQDRIIAIDGRMVANTSDLVSKISEISQGTSFDLRLVRDGQLVETTIPSSIQLSTNQQPQPTVAAATPKAGASESSVEDSRSSASQSSASKSSGSLLGGLGSVLGGVFGGGGKPTAPSKKPSSAEAPETVTETLDAPIAELMPPAKPVGNIEPVDVLALEPPTEDDGKDQLKQEIERLKSQLRQLEQKVEQ